MGLFSWRPRSMAQVSSSQGLMIQFSSSAETKYEDASRFQSLLSLGFDSVRVIPSIGRSGGLAIAWKSSSIVVTILEEHRQIFHLHCQSSASPLFFLTAVYVIPHSNLRSELWSNLLRISHGVTLLGERVNDCGLVDMGSFGPRMTWNGSRIEGFARLFERLDRAFANSSLLVSFLDSYVQLISEYGTCWLAEPDSNLK
ncbi:hypothetical protein K1719_016738 [Acacia pycnantha]|nr:hypothetical protein K1719_016738 [Acacia pycnantha]